MTRQQWHRRLTILAVPAIILTTCFAYQAAHHAPTQQLIETPATPTGK